MTDVVPSLKAIVAPAAVGLALFGCAATPDSAGPALPEGITRDFAGASIRGQVTIVDFFAVF